MHVERVKDRNMIFTFDGPGWDLNIQVILGDHQIYVVDTGLGNEAMDRIQEYLQDSGNDKPVVGINTHYHWDHVWGNGHELFGKHQIICHSQCRSILVKRWDEDFRANKQHACGDVLKSLPTLVFENMIQFPCDQVKILYTPGHTIDSISVMDEKDHVLNVGDNIGDAPDALLPEIETSNSLYSAVISEYKVMDVDVCVSGHNRLMGPEVFAQISEMELPLQL